VCVAALEDNARSSVESGVAGTAVAWLPSYRSTPLISLMSRLDPNLKDASAALGAGRWRTLFRVIVPLSLPGLLAGCLLVFSSSVTAFVSQTIIGGGRMVLLPFYIWQQATTLFNWPFAAAISIVLLLSVLTVVVVLNALGRRSHAYAHV
jgi:putative spermidine/putrescine transport system permease protein